MDDLLIYMLGEERYLVVANACNADEVFHWFQSVASGEARLSNENPGFRMAAPPKIRSLQDRTASGDAMRVDLGFQGPRTRDALMRLAAKDPQAQRFIMDLEKSEQRELRIGAYDVILSRTGYTGEEFGYEVFVHPDQAGDLWKELLEVGHDLGIGPAGLGARDSLRAEAGFPLYGHELAGDHNILPCEAGYASFVKEHKPFFVGREPHLSTARVTKRSIARIKFEHQGIRMFQPGDPVVNGRGTVVGVMTSTVLPGEHQLALALVDKPSSRIGQRLAAFLRPRKVVADGAKPVHELGLGDQIPVPEPAVVLTRFPKRIGEDVGNTNAG
jgi:glycine hydroxymethyltransferase